MSQLEIKNVGGVIAIIRVESGKGGFEDDRSHRIPRCGCWFIFIMGVYWGPQYCAIGPTLEQEHKMSSNESCSIEKGVCYTPTVTVDVSDIVDIECSRKIKKTQFNLNDSLQLMSCLTVFIYCHFLSLAGTLVLVSMAAPSSAHSI